MTDEQTIIETPALIEPPAVIDTPASETVIAEALSIIDSALAKMMQRELVASGEVADLLLDIRVLLTTHQTSDSV